MVIWPHHYSDTEHHGRVLYQSNAMCSLHTGQDSENAYEELGTKYTLQKYSPQ